MTGKLEIIRHLTRGGSRADHIQPKTSAKMGGFEAKDCAFAVWPRHFGPLTRFIVAREAFLGMNECAVTGFCAV
jgi:hypothetical protein